MEYELVDVSGTGTEGRCPRARPHPPALHGHVVAGSHGLPAVARRSDDGHRRSADGRPPDRALRGADGEADPYALVDDAFLPLLVAVGHGQGNWTESGDMLRLSGAEVSSVRRVGTALEVRVFNPTANEVQVDIGHRTGWLVDLRGLPEGDVEGTFPLGPWRIATLRLR